MFAINPVEEKKELTSKCDTSADICAWEWQEEDASKLWTFFLFVLCRVRGVMRWSDVGEKKCVLMYSGREITKMFLLARVYLSVSTTRFKIHCYEITVFVILRDFLSENITMTRQNLHGKIHQQYFTPTALSFFSPSFSLTALYTTTKIIHISLSFMIRIANCLCLLPFINIKGKEWPWAVTKKWGMGKQGRRVMYVMPQMFYLWVSSTRPSSASCQAQPENVWN